MSAIDESTRRESDNIVEGMLRDSDLRKPPIQIIGILEYLKVHRDFYSFDDPRLLQRLGLDGARRERLFEDRPSHELRVATRGKTHAIACG